MAIQDIVKALTGSNQPLPAVMTDWTYLLGQALGAANENPRSGKQRTYAGMAAALQGPKQMQVLAEKKALDEQDRKAKAEKALLDALNINSEVKYRDAMTQDIPLDTAVGQTNAATGATNAATSAGELLLKQNAAKEPKRAIKIDEFTNESGKRILAMQQPDGKITYEEGPAVLKPAPTTDKSIQPFEVWREQNPKAPVADWLALEAKNKPAPAPQLAIIRTTDENGGLVTKIVPKTAGSTFAGAPTAQEQNRRDQAAIIDKQVDHVIALIDKTPNAVGPILGRIAKGEKALGTVSPEAMALGTALGSMEALQPILHGYRGGSQTMDHFHSIIGDQHINAAALKASLLEIKQLAESIRRGGNENDAGVTDIDKILDSVFGPKK